MDNGALTPSTMIMNASLGARTHGRRHAKDMGDGLTFWPDGVGWRLIPNRTIASIAHGLWLTTNNSG